ncbi:GntR family transcriptional regulator [Neorhizobium sp. NCHU2750]|uniref:GntR family transcriptional regulator n=1 Tax=Neorhizobium sp. NCHU2750 TaxID=1825976 RepID=UPI000E72E76A|nr:transcriptional regulator [Neorhizobium sp. NCHU2750]
MLDTESPFLPKISTDIVTVAETKIRHDILAGALLPGERLSEQVLCRHYKLGRGIIRAVLVRLSHRGFVSSQARSGWKVAPITAVGLREIALGRRQLEPLLADVDLSEADIGRIEAICTMQTALAAQPRLSADNIALLRGYDREVRDLVAGQLKAPLLSGWLANLWDRSEYYLNFLEAGCATRLPPTDWTKFIEAKKTGQNARAAAFLKKTADAFFAFTQDQLLQSNFEVSAVARARKKSSDRSDAAKAKPEFQQPSPKRTF